MFENKTYEGIHYSRFVASWAKEIGKIDWKFKAWLTRLTINHKPIPKEIVNEIFNYATCGKMELEGNAIYFMGTFKETEWEDF